MKFNLLLLTFSLWVIATTRLTSQQITIDLLPGSCTTQSSFADSSLYNSCANGENLNTTNQTITQNILTKSENYPWWHTDLGDVAILDTLLISGLSGGSSTTHIFYSMFPMYSRIPSELMTSPVVNHIYLEETANVSFSIPLNNAKARYITIIADGNNFLAIGGVQIMGRFSTGEIPGNNIDDDLDGRVDCNDPLLIPFIRDILIAEPSSMAALDGQIHVLTTTQNIEYSLDNGINFYKTAVSQDIASIYTQSGTYNLILKNNFGCMDSWIGNPLVLPERAGPPQEDHCGNGDFHTGTFAEWTGGIGVPTGNFNAAFNNESFWATAHAILPENLLLSDPLVGNNIQFLPPGGGSFARLGNPLIQGGQAFRLTNCLEITAANSIIDFSVAGVMDFGTVGHDEGQQAYFQVHVFSPNTIGTSEILNEIFTGGPAGNMNFFGPSTFDPMDGEFWFLPWTCFQVDLNNFIGETVCFEYIASGCSFTNPAGIHRSYMYLNGICKDHSPPLDADFSMPETVCINSDFQVTPGTFSGDITSHAWEIELISPASTDFIEIPPIPGPPVAISDILGRWINQFQRPIPCDAVFRITLKLFGRCQEEEFSISKEITVVCPLKEVDYCDLALCSGYQTVQMQGTNTCTGCTIQWNGGGFLNDDHEVFPTVLTGNNGWSDHVYSVQVLEPNGCIHTDEVNINLTSLSSGLLSVNEVCIDNCSFALQVVYEANSAIDPSNFIIQIFDQTNTLFFEPESFTMETLPSGRIRHLFELTDPILADLEESTYTVQIHPIVPEGFCEIGNCDFFLETEITIPKNRFLKVPLVYVPNIFNPNASTPADQVFNPFFSHASPEGGVYWVELSIWDRNGSLIYLNELQTLPACTNLYGYAGDEPGFPWNGHVDNDMGNNCGPFNNDPCLCAPGVYGYIIKYRNCLQEWQIAGDVTLELD